MVNQVTCDRILFNSPESKFWTSPQEKLPIEKGDYLIEIPEIKWKIKGTHANNEVQIIKTQNRNNARIQEKPLRLIEKLKIFILRLPYRPDISCSAYELHKYSSLAPFWKTNKSDSKET